MQEGEEGGRLADGGRRQGKSSRRMERGSGCMVDGCGGGAASRLTRLANASEETKAIEERDAGEGGEGS